MGPNGSGKTTPANAITGFFPPTKGEIQLQGRTITGLPPDRVASIEVARTLQNLNGSKWVKEPDWFSAHHDIVWDIASKEAAKSQGNRQ